MASQSRDGSVSFWAHKSHMRLLALIGWGLVIFCRVHSLHAQIQDFLSGWGVQSQRPENNQDNICFFLLLFSFSPQLIWQFTEGVQWFYYRENYTFSRIEGIQLFPGGGGVQVLISIETHINCDFPGGSGPLSPALDSHIRLLWS